MSNWYDKYLSIYGKPFSEVPQEIIDGTRERPLFLWIQHFNRSELSARGLAFAYNADYGCKEEYRVDIIRGEDGTSALSLKKYGKIKFIHDCRCRAILGYGTFGNQSLWQIFLQHIKNQSKVLMRIFYTKEHYVDNEDNLVKNR